MPKKLIAIPKGNLMRVAASKGHDTLSALKEKAGVDRKTLRAIEAGRPVKETTLQSIANRLRVPMTHLVGSSVVESHDPRDQHREFKLQRLDAAALRKLAGEHNDINWILKFDQISEDLETLLLKLRESLKGWFFQRDFLDDEAGDNLTIQIAPGPSLHTNFVKTSLTASILSLLMGICVGLARQSSLPKNKS